MKCVKNMCILLFLVTGWGCSDSSTREILTEAYPRLYEAVLERDADAVMSFTDHPIEEVRLQSWRAMASTPVDDMDAFMHQVKSTNEYVAWMALAQKSLTDLQLEMLYSDWLARPDSRSGISLVLGLQGDEETLAFLISQLEEIKGSDDELESALAIGRLIGEFGIDAETEQEIISHAITLDDEKLSRAYLYGYYRNGMELKNDTLVPEIRRAYIESDESEVQQYLLRLGLQNNGPLMLGAVEDSSIVHMDPQLAIELAQQTGEFEWSDKMEIIYKELIRHHNPVVNEVALSILGNKPEKPESFNDFIVDEVVTNEDKDVSIRLSGLLALSYPGGYDDLIEELTEAGDYLVIKELAIYRKVLEPKDYFEEIRANTNSENRREVLFAVQALNGWWPNLDEVTRKKVGEEKVRELVFSILERGDRSITYSASALLNSPSIIKDSDYTRLEELLSRFSLPEDIEVYQSISEVLKNRFEEESKSLIDSIAKEGNAALNNTLIQQGWDIPESETEPEEFLIPDWQRLVELGEHPVWILETTKGTIEVEMDVLSAPATITGMDSLIVSGAYDDVAFHRVVPNFVVQGGDVETGDGFGGPDYVVPTESSAEQYWRGTVGIASAGTDTEGSQYFFMHQWKPHLNARYTVVGTVIEGMDVVDRMLVGDKVLRSYWSQQ